MSSATEGGLTLPALPAAPSGGAAAGRCWICGGTALRRLWPANLDGALRPSAFRITDAAYGRTGDIDQCRGCGFRQCATLGDVLGFYESMDDLGYEQTREERALQARRLLQAIPGAPAGRTLLDVGAGSGIMVAEALRLGYRAEGIEPSRALHAEARRRGLPVHQGVLPHADIADRYDVVLLVDVIEHVTDPMALLRAAVASLADDGVLLVVTPDVGSVAARLLGRRWWHYRVAHVGYFDRRTLAQAVRAAGLEPLHVERPRWYFPASYLLQRALGYLPGGRRLPIPRFLARTTVALNLFDSLLMTCRRAPRGAAGA